MEMRDHAVEMITLGEYPSGAAMCREIENRGNHIQERARELLNDESFPVSWVKKNIILVYMSVAGLGFPDGAPREIFYPKALSRGYQFCPAEVGPALRIQYQGQPRGETIFIAMDRIGWSPHGPSAFDVFSWERGMILGAHFGDPDYICRPTDFFAFVLPLREYLASLTKIVRP